MKGLEQALWILVAAGAFHAAYAWGKASWLMIVYLFALLQLARSGSWRKTYYAGLAVGFLIATIRLAFFWRIFSGGAIGLWYVYAFWIGLFVALAGVWLKAPVFAWRWLLIPFLWTGLEYFRSELYYLRFSWLSPGYAFGAGPGLTPLKGLGAYGIGFVLTGLACAAAFCWEKSKVRSLAVLALAAGMAGLAGWWQREGDSSAPIAAIRVGAVQLECPAENEVLLGLDHLLRQQPDLDLIVLSEYTFFDQVPERVKAWCRKNRRYLVVGAEDPVSPKNYRNTVFVIGPSGDVVFRQAKAVPIQFFRDGLPAAEQKLWDSPWGRIGICVCYDLSYTRVTDRLVRLGAQALIVPTMDVMDWGRRQHELHARIAPARAVEYGIPIFRVASSGISQLVDGTGHILAAGPCGEQGASIVGTLALRRPGTLPPDRWLAPLSTGVTLVVVLWLLFRRFAPHSHAS
jgi:apolipoprotein N-acyltransferase